MTMSEEIATPTAVAPATQDAGCNARAAGEWIFGKWGYRRCLLCNSLPDARIFVEPRITAQSIHSTPNATVAIIGHGAAA